MPNLIEKLSKKQLLMLIFIIALILRFGTILILGQEQNLTENGAIALNLISGNGFSMEFFMYTKTQETCSMAPFFPFFIAFFYLIFGVNSNALFAIQIVQVIIGACTVFPIYFLAKKFFSHRVAALSCLLFAFYPDFIYSVQVIHPLTITTFLIPTLIYYASITLDNPIPKRSIYTGFLFGISLLVEPIIFSILGLMLLCFIISGVFEKYIKKSSTNFKVVFIPLKKKFKSFLLILIFCGLIITPWLIRCYIVYDGRFVFIKATGFNLWRGNNPEYTESGLSPFYYNRFNNETKEGLIDQMYFNAAIEYILNNIPVIIENNFQKFIDFWWFPKPTPEQSPLIRKLIYAPLLILFILGLIVGRKRIIELVPLLIPLFSFTIIYSFTFVLPRYRVPVQPIIFIFSIFAFLKCSDYILNKIKKNKSGI